MAYGELYLPPEPPKRNAVTGRFMKGHEPANKGKERRYVLATYRLVHISNQGNGGRWFS